ncbi:MAG: sulfide/dihydroorotate dehydrogenase-like FAD/NAD-binding protein [Desulfobulbaceae bacterium]|jgi:NADH dehydrogenase/NADH:ubiquinone oxidoreductase subunit G/NAD(P)H-flavin reductase|nr:sulfide/dihydroorotate dehydrogenase-like FAD/NAD-binding protein [Desulfobulbaceae bacterium]
MGSISLTIDGRTVEVEEGKTVLQAAREAGITIPTICDHKDLNPYGSCRMCVVEIDGVRGYPTSCTTPAVQGMQVTTTSERLTTLRNRTLELMFSGHPNSCLVCPHREACEKYRPKATKAARSTRCGFCANREECDLRTMALKGGSRDLYLPTLYASYNLERDDPFMDRDYNLCVLCGRCSRICEKIHGKPAISIINRGKWARIGTAFHKSHVHSGCTFCGACIDICPTGTLTDRFARWQGKPEAEVPSTCIICSEGCSVIAQSKGGQSMANIMTGFNPEASLCALGRFGYAQIVNSSQRLLHPLVREGEDHIPSDWEGAIQAAIEGLQVCVGATALVISATTTREDRFLYTQLAEHLQATLLILPAEAANDDPQIREMVGAVQQGKIRGLLTNGDFLSADLLRAANFSLVIDCLPSTTTSLASIVLPAAVLSETGGTFRTAVGTVKQMAASSRAPGDARPEWQILCDLGQALGSAAFDFSRIEAVTPLVSDDPAPAAIDGDPRQNVRELIPRFRGHLLADIVPALAAFGLPATEVAAVEAVTGAGFAILEKREIVPNMHFFKIRAPQVAKFAQPGQFVILMARETSERSPFTLVDWNGPEGWITVVIEEVGRSSRELASLKAGERIAHVSGPLGLPFPIEKKGTVLLGGGCYGIGAIFPLARALRQAGNRVICTIEASSAYLLFFEEEFRAVSDQLILATKDGSRGVWGGVQEVLAQVAQEETLDQFIAIGCTFMMRMVCEASRPLGIPTFVALNPIMVDGTGMCGACRVSVGDQTRFACIDGPIFDGHSVDWDELALRRSAYAREEVQALSQTVDLSALIYKPESDSCGCGRK